jgi:hypothetical protein
MPHARTGHHQRGEGARQSRGPRGEAPEQHASGHQEAARNAIAQKAADGRGQHEHHHEEAAEQSRLGVVELEVALDVGQGDRDDVPVEVVDQVDEREDEQG